MTVVVSVLRDGSVDVTNWNGAEGRESGEEWSGRNYFRTSKDRLTGEEIDESQSACRGLPIFGSINWLLSCRLLRVRLQQRRVRGPAMRAHELSGRGRVSRTRSVGRFSVCVGGIGKCDERLLE